MRGDPYQQEQEDIHSEGELQGKQSLLIPRPMGRGVQKGV